ncbi:phage portal protein [Sphingomonas sp. MMS24-J45]|uniref:phage portal protein n=1 Tax=Sphingomonas sp. MMS24-J45 TaxID=3238806 RepID=UPI00384E3320
MKIFGWKAGRAEARPDLSRGYAAPATVLPRTYDAQVREGYMANAITRRAVQIVASGVSSAPLTGASPAVLTLVRARSAGQALLEVVASHLLLHGDAFVQFMTDETGALVELYALRPERVSVETDASGWPVAYRYRVGDRSTRLIADRVRPEIVHIKTFHPLNDHYGLGGMSAAAKAVALHNAATAWNTGLLDNAARPSGALVYDPGDGSTLSREQFERLQGQMDETFSGARNAGRPMLLEGGLKWQALSLSPADMDFTGMKAAAAREIATSFGVPPMLLGLPGDATYANYKEANRALWRETILPLADAILGTLSQALGGWFEDAEIRVDLDRVLALAEDRERLWAQVTAADFLSREEKRAMLGIVEPIAAGAGA